MKILVIANNSEGLYIFREMLLRNLIEKGLDVYVLVPCERKVEELKLIGCKLINVDVDRRSINPFADFKLIVSYFKLIQKIKPEKIITYTIKPNVYGGIVARIKKIPLYANITGLGTAFQNNGIINRIAVLLYKIAFKNVDKIFFENQDNKMVFLLKGIAPEGKMVCLNGAGVDLDKYTYTRYPKDTTVNFLFIGRVMREKGIYELLEATEKLKNKGLNVRLHIVGYYDENCESDILKNANEGPVVYHGYQEDIKPFVEMAHCFVLPSYHEGMANTLLECGAMGRPLITSNICGCKEAVIDGETGFLCNVRDSEDLFLKMKYFVELPNDIREEMGKASYRHISKVFDKKDVVKETLENLMQ